MFHESSYWNWDVNSTNKKVKNTSQGDNFDPLSSKEFSSHDDSPPLKERSLQDIDDSWTFALMTIEPLSYEEA